MKKILIIISILAILTGGVLFGYSRWAEAKESKFLSSNGQTKDNYAIIKMRVEQLKKDSKNYDAFMSLAFAWKGIGDATKDEKYLRRSAKTYDKVIARWGNKAYLPFVNRANVYISLKEYSRAEDDLKIALEIDPGEQNLYIDLAELYSGYMNKDSQVVKAVYEKGLKTLVGG